MYIFFFTSTQMYKFYNLTKFQASVKPCCMKLGRDLIQMLTRSATEKPMQQDTRRWPSSYIIYAWSSSQLYDNLPCQHRCVLHVTKQEHDVPWRGHLHSKSRHNCWTGAFLTCGHSQLEGGYQHPWMLTAQVWDSAP